jgi:hypothetical protein
MSQDLVRRTIAFVLTAFACVSISATAYAAEPNLRFSVGVDYSTGKYGENDSTDILYIPLSVKYETDSYALKATVPWLQIDSPGGVVVGGGPDAILTGQPTGGGRTTDSGLGDIVLAATAYAYPGSDTLPMVDFTGKIKVPTADENKGLGTGEVDYAVETELTKIYGKSALFGTLGYKVFGDPPGTEINDVFYLSLGNAYRVDPKTTVGLLYDVREATVDSRDGVNELTPYVSLKTGRSLRVLGYLVAGLSDGSPDWEIGVVLSRDTGVDELRRYLPSFLRTE